MRIAFITNLAEEVVLRASLIRGMQEGGHEVVACVSHLSSPAASEEATEMLRCRFARLDRTGLNPLGDLRYFVDLVRFLRHERPDITLNRALKPVVYGSLAARAAGVRSVYSLITGLGSAFLGTSWKRRLLRRLARVLYRAALAGNKRVFFQNSEDLGMFLDHRMIRSSEQAVLLNGAGVDTHRFQKASIPKGKVCFLFIGRLIKDKGVYEYVNAAKILSRKYPGLRFMLIGRTDGNPSSVSLSEVNAWVQAGFLEWQSRVEDVRPWIAQAGVFVLPSYREGSPRAALEAMAMGRPLITTVAPGCRDTVQDGGNGFLVPIGDADAVASAMERFVLDPPLMERMGSRSREVACEKFDIRTVNSAILQGLGLRKRATAGRHPQHRLGGQTAQEPGRGSGLSMDRGE